MLRPSCRSGSSLVACSFWGRKNVFTQPGSTTDLTALKPDFRFTPESRLRAGHRTMSGSCQQRNAASFDYLVGAAEQREWDGETERLCGLEVYNQLDLRRLHDRQVGRLLALENF